MTHTEDTLFLVLEPDYCMRKEDEMARKEWLDAVAMESLECGSLSDLQHIIGNDAVREEFIERLKQYKKDKADRPPSLETPWPAKRSDAGSSRDKPKAGTADRAPGTRGKAQPGNRLYYSGDREIDSPTKPVAQISISAEDCSPELLDMVEMCNEASRAGVGEFVWASWDSSHWGPRPKNAKYRAQTPSAGAHFMR